MTPDTPDPVTPLTARAFAEDLIAEIGSMMSVNSWSKVETQARRSAYNDVLVVISDRLATLDRERASRVTPDERHQYPVEVEIRRHHAIVHRPGIHGDESWCDEDNVLQPCDTQVVLGLLDAASRVTQPTVAALTFAAFAETNRQRCEAPDGFGHPLSAWSLSDWMLAATGEFGEAANVAKKLNRERDGIPGNTKSASELHDDLADEFADAVIYLDLAAQSQGIDLGSAVASKFNRTSEKIGAPHRIAALPVQEATPTPIDAMALREAMRAVFDTTTRRRALPYADKLVAAYARLLSEDPKG